MACWGIQRPTQLINSLLLHAHLGHPYALPWGLRRPNEFRPSLPSLSAWVCDFDLIRCSVLDCRSTLVVSSGRLGQMDVFQLSMVHHLRFELCLAQGRCFDRAGTGTTPSEQTADAKDRTDPKESLAAHDLFPPFSGTELTDAEGISPTWAASGGIGYLPFYPCTGLTRRGLSWSNSARRPVPTPFLETCLRGAESRNCIENGYRESGSLRIRESDVKEPHLSQMDIRIENHNSQGPK